MTNNYKMAFSDQTTGWDPSCNDVNAKNWFGMFPAEVALQAGDIKEFSEIISHPEFKPESLGRVDLFLETCRFESEEAYKKIREFFIQKFKFDKISGQFVVIA